MSKLESLLERKQLRFAKQIKNESSKATFTLAEGATQVAPSKVCRRGGFTLAEGATQVAPSKVCRRGGFTLAEVLITLAVVGVVAILVMPKLLDNVADRKYDAARKKALATIGEASRQIAMEGEMTSAVDAEDFVKNYLSKKLSIVKTCANNKLGDCGFEAGGNKIKTLTGIAWTIPNKMDSYIITVDNPNTYGFVMSNGYSVDLMYNPGCEPFHVVDETRGGVAYTGTSNVCVNAIYDMNGNAKPNQVGKDIGFVTVLYPDETVKAYAPMISSPDLPSVNFVDINSVCTQYGNDFYPASSDESVSLVFNRLALRGSFTVGAIHIMSPEVAPTRPVHALAVGTSTRFSTPKTSNYGVPCIKR